MLKKWTKAKTDLMEAMQLKPKDCVSREKLFGALVMAKRTLTAYTTPY